ncbi:MAG: prephenate dehydratase, partial [Smithellaceae bacterium]|nr:prephenate dehydratase [Smithellaceae bacterium]
RSLQAIFREIISASRLLQEPLVVACLGPEASFTHLAAERHFGSTTSFACQGAISGVFHEVQKGNARIGVVPMENSLEGSVNLTLDCLIDTPLYIQSEILMRINHCLLSSAESLTELEQVYSHPQALAQCQGWLRTHLPRCRLIDMESTAAAARLVAGDPKSAAIGSRLAGSRYNLNILRESIEDNETNITRFLVIGQEPCAPTGQDKTSVIFSTIHRPGSLHLALEPFARRQVNLLKIESYPMKGRLWEYLFFVDFTGHRDQGETGQCLAELANHTSFIKVLGSYPIGEVLT